MIALRIRIANWLAGFISRNSTLYVLHSQEEWEGEVSQAFMSTRHKIQSAIREHEQSKHGDKHGS